MEPFDALLLALTLAVTAPTDAKSDEALAIAENIASKLPDSDLERAKKMIEALILENIFIKNTNPSQLEH